MKLLRAAVAALAVSAGAVWTGPALSQTISGLAAPPAASFSRGGPAVRGGDRRFHRPDRRFKHLFQRERKREGHRRFRNRYPVVAYGYDGSYDNYYDSFGDSPFWRDEGFFFGPGTTSMSGNGSVHYDYDRGYPYDYYSGDRSEGGNWDRSARAPSCRVQWTKDTQGRDARVRICSR